MPEEVICNTLSTLLLLRFKSWVAVWLPKLSAPAIAAAKDEDVNVPPPIIIWLLIIFSLALIFDAVIAPLNVWESVLLSPNMLDPSVCNIDEVTIDDVILVTIKLSAVRVVVFILFAVILLEAVIFVVVI